VTISARVIADSISEHKVRITTLELRYPRFIHAEFMTHRMFSRNASSSRAIPVERLIQDILDDTAMPVRWGVANKGMQDGGEMSEFDAALAKREWLEDRDYMIARVRKAMARPTKPAKQWINRKLEPWSHITVLVTATEWNNFWSLRIHKDAQPEMRELAISMFEAMDVSKPFTLLPEQWHLPFITQQDYTDVARHIKNTHPVAIHLSDADLYFLGVSLLQKISIARCARVSYLNHDGSRPSIEADLALYDRLLAAEPLHASPAEHQATPDDIKYDAATNTWEWEAPHFHGNFVGWQQYRKMLVGENVATNRTSGK